MITCPSGSWIAAAGSLSRSARSRAGDTQALSFTLTPALLIKSSTFMTASSSSRPCFASRWV